MRSRTVAAALACATALWTGGRVAPAVAQVRLEVLPDGTRVMHNHGGAPRASRAGRTRSARAWEPLVRRHAEAQGLEFKLVDAVIRAESAYDPRAISRRGAMGLMQLMPATARELRVLDPFDPEQNLKGGTTYLRRMLDRFGRVDLALAAYNAGPEAVRRYGGTPPYAETRGYVRRVLDYYTGDPSAAWGGATFGRPTFLVRDRSGRIVMTTDPPARP